MGKRVKGRRAVSDFQEFILANLREQARLELELVRTKRFATASQFDAFAPRIVQLNADLAALQFAMNLRRLQELRDSLTRSRKLALLPSKLSSSRLNVLERPLDDGQGEKGGRARVSCYPLHST